MYHDKTCPLYRERVPTPSACDDDPENGTSPVTLIRHSESVCSCGAMDKLSDVQDVPTSSTDSVTSAQVVIANEMSAKVGFTADAAESFESCAKPELGESPNHISTASDGSDHSCAIKVNELKIDSGFPVDGLSTALISLSTNTPPEYHTKSLPDGNTSTTVDSASGNDGQAVPPSEASGKCSDDLTRAKTNNATSTSLGSNMQIGNIQQRARSPEGHQTGRSPSPHKEDMSIPRDSGGSPRPSSSPKDHGLLSRTLESLSSLGSSFPGSPNLSSLATGLFNWNQDGSPESNATASALTSEKSQDDNDVFMETEPTTLHQPSFGSQGNTAQMDEGIRSSDDIVEAKSNMHTDIEMESIVKLSDKPELFKDLSGKIVKNNDLHYAGMFVCGIVQIDFLSVLVIP